MAILHRCDPDGRHIRPISCNIEHDNTPWMLPDGRVLYTRWEYIDRSRVLFHHLWTVNPDGTAQMTYFGNMHPGTVMIDAKPIPGTNSIISIFSPGHGRKEHAGRLTIVNPDGGPDARSFVQPVGGSSNCRDPYALTKDLFLVAEERRILLIDRSGASRVVWRTAEPDMAVHEPRPLRPRPRGHAVPSRMNWQASTGQLVLADVTHGRNMGGVGRGEVRKLLVLETLPKPVNFSGTMEPISLGGTFTLPRVLGTVPVEPDGSAYMVLPALRPLFFVALDENEMSVKRMQSFVSVMPGERTSCSGCHENRTDTARFVTGLMALDRPPSPITPLDGIPEVFDFPRDIQPILDRHCLRCHGYDRRPAADLPLVGARGGTYSHSYYALLSRGHVSHGQDRLGNHPPRAIGTASSPLMKRINSGHSKVRLSGLERRKIIYWVESGAPYPGTYAALGSGMVRSHTPDAGVLKRRCVGCHGSDPKRGPQFKKYSRELLCNLTEPEKSPLLLAPLAKETGGWGLCRGDAVVRHPAPPKPLDAPALDPPKASPKSGGPDPLARGEPALAGILNRLEPDKPPKQPPAPHRPAPPQPEAATEEFHVPVVFASKKDPDYAKLLAGIEAAKQQLDAVTRFDMPKFRPNEHYVREMKRYGVLPAAFDVAKDPINVYEVDEAYWRSFWWPPPAPAAAP